LKKAGNLHENIFVAAVFAVGAAVFCGNTGLRYAMTEPLTPGGYGKGVAVLLCAACVARLIWINFIEPANHAAQAADANKSEFQIKEKFLIISQMLLMILYAYGITKIGYFTSTYIYSFISVMLLTNSRTWKSVLIYAVGLIAFCYCLYLGYGVFKVMMPNTPLI